MFRFVVLGLLQQGGPGHGYALMKRYRDRSGVQISTGNFYRELQRLMAGGFVRFAAREPDTDARRAPYEIVGDGREAFGRWLGTPVAPSETGEDPICSRAMFLDCVPRDAALTLIDDWRDALQTAQAALQRERDEARRRSGAEAGFSILPQLVSRRLAHVASDLAFLDELRAAVEKWHATPRAAAAGDVVAVYREAEAQRHAARAGAGQTAPR
ncbi:MAG: PadR family transcriptional regulator [Thermodesulfobacteriota bacterium]